MPTVLVIDVGSSSIRAILFDSDLQYTILSQRAHQFTTDKDGTAVADAEHLRTHVEECLDTASSHQFDAVGMTTFAGNLVGVNDDRQAVTAIYTYADTRNAPDVAALREHLDVSTIHQRTGCIIHTAYHPARFHWLQRTNPELMAQVTQWIDFGTYCYMKWFGEVRASYSVSSWSGMLNRESLTWDEFWLNELEIPHEKLPLLADFDEAMTGLRQPYADRWRDVPFFLPVGDGAAANIGAGAYQRDKLALTVGTTAALRRVTDEKLPAVPDGLWSYRVDKTHHLVGGATSEGGNVYEWATNTLKLPDDAENQLQQRETDSHGLTFIPLLAGERSPGYNPYASGVLIGLHRGSTPLDILQAGLEGLAIRLSIIARALINQDVTIIAGGNAITSSPALAQMIASAFDYPLRIPDVAETTARGVATLVQSALEGKPWSAYPEVSGTIVEPQAQAVRKLDAARQRQLDLYQLMVEIWKKNASDTF
ncbi:MAG: carbohydrate kinase [Chloroflexi bacterium]|nr:carbohydrate kinase [Chloroflexota bacterium]